MPHRQTLFEVAPYYSIKKHHQKNRPFDGVFVYVYLNQVVITCG